MMISAVVKLYFVAAVLLLHFEYPGAWMVQ